MARNNPLVRLVVVGLVLIMFTASSGVVGAHYHEEDDCDESEIPGPTEACPEEDLGVEEDGSDAAMVAGDSYTNSIGANPESLACRQMVQWSGSEFIGLSIWGASQCVG